MKLIIDIDSEDYDFLKDSHLSYNMDLLSKQSDKDIKGTLTLLRLVDNVKNGTSLSEKIEKINAEIQKYVAENKNSEDLYLAGCGDGAYHILAIINKIISEPKENK